MGQLCGCMKVDQSTLAIKETFGKFDEVLKPGCHFVPWCFGRTVVGRLSLRVEQLEVRCETKTKDNVFVNIVASIQYCALANKAYDAFYKLSNTRQQIRAYVFDVVRASVPKLKLDEVFEQKNEIGKDVESELGKVMSDYGYKIVKALIVDIDPNELVKKSMNEINAAARLRIAANERAEGEKILQVKRAGAEAEAMFLAGVGLARQRQAIVDGLRDSVLAFAESVSSTSAKEVVEMVLVTLYFDTMKEIGESSRASSVFVPHDPDAVQNIASQRSLSTFSEWFSVDTWGISFRGSNKLAGEDQLGRNCGIRKGKEVKSPCCFRSEKGSRRRYTPKLQVSRHYGSSSRFQLAGHLSLRLQQLDVKCETKTKDNVFVNVVASIQYRALADKASDAFYKLSNTRSQIQAYVFDVIRASVPKLNLDDAFEQKNEIAKAVEDELEKAMSAYGFEIVQTLIVDIEPDEHVKRAMNEINAAARMRVAANEKAEAEKILQIKRAEGEAESKYLSGLGIARQRQAIVDGLRDSVLGFSVNVPGTTAKDVMDMVLVTQYFDTMKEIGAASKSSAVFIPHGPGAVRDVATQIREGLLQASSAHV
ncbi:hypothetical protein H6P81_004737 [Aristolochia fimbriata]|uniref:Band 7 domain-containing protein n=1 Tax=Aristolochia fimbriata TaxID=158543 RepID=A0AAV7EX01_ARIFI|nr:hypothetical protein H6P81_004737 [Aristolochia fimbriata]